ncbi:hypothetical protein CBM2625_U10030 [Cupriavidus taiwanensis]|uniref:Uncharacterized protein n=1 Tax=Cupriavidus taiwanensis TaxID=164546 RepID=A0A375HAF7_9BURK|nr:hypothetical protein CBM2625_U10030 [Cupriavidus taiwanensis]SPA57652.1 hypothetical protein CBM2638_U10016 [Cupriavidus taiwanensis]SPD48984.1 protein of unknown function [Cupriavidus taiwanensis]
MDVTVAASEGQLESWGADVANEILVHGASCFLDTRGVAAMASRRVEPPMAARPA